MVSPDDGATHEITEPIANLRFEAHDLFRRHHHLAVQHPRQTRLQPRRNLASRCVPDSPRASIVQAPCDPASGGRMKRTRLMQRRRTVGLNQEALAEQLGIDVSTVRRWEYGHTLPQPWQRPNLAAALKI